MPGPAATRPRLRPLIFHQSRGIDPGDRSGGPKPRRGSLHCIQLPPPHLLMLAASSERKSSWFARFGSWPWPRSRPALQRRRRPRRPNLGRRARALRRRRDLWGDAPEGEAPSDSAQKARGKAGPDRSADHRPCPAVLPDPRHAGSSRHGRQRLRLQHVQPADADRGHLPGHARPGEAYRPVRQCRARVDPVQVLSSARDRSDRSGQREQRLDRNLKSRRIKPRHAVGQHSGFDRVARPTLVMDSDAPIGIEDEIMVHARKREIAAELAAMIDRRRARRQDFDHENRD